ncbi:MAG: hypothetical protein ACKVP4_10370 [Hyphomicrobium sp.]
MKSTVTLALAAIVAAGALLPAFSTEAEARRGRNRALAAGVVLGLGTAAVLSSDGAYARGRGHRARCRDLDYRCDMGSERACYKFDRYC